jgi:hypothetical protein
MDPIKMLLLGATAGAAVYSATQVRRARAKVKDFFDLGTNSAEAAADAASDLRNTIEGWLGLSGTPRQTSNFEGPAVDLYGEQAMRALPEESSLG